MVHAVDPGWPDLVVELGLEETMECGEGEEVEWGAAEQAS